MGRRWIYVLTLIWQMFFLSLPSGEGWEKGEEVSWRRLLYDACLAGEREISLPVPLPLEEIERIYFALLDDSPELVWVANRFAYTGDADGIWSVYPIYLCSSAEIAVLRERLSDAAANFLTALPRGASDYAAAYALHDALAAVTAYSFTADMPLGSDGVYTAYGALVAGEAVCRGYAMAYLLLLRAAGIEARYIHSDSMAHGWVMACLDGRWLHIDVTWDDGRVLSHRRFARTDAAMAAMGYMGWQ